MKPPPPHSPAPWLAVEGDSGSFWEIIDASAHTVMILQGQHAEGNAYITATAPEMFQLLRDFCAMLDGFGVGDTAIITDSERKLYAQARILIFKAEGKAGEKMKE